MNATTHPPRGPGLADAAASVLAALRGPWTLSQESLALLAAVYMSLTANLTFFRIVAQAGALAGSGGARLGVGLFMAITALNWLLMLLAMNRWTARPVLAALLVANAFAAYFMGRYTVYLDPEMIRNILHTDRRESGELLSPAMLAFVLVAGVLPAIALYRIRFVRRTSLRACGVRAAAILVALAVAAGAIFASYQPLASLMRNHREVRYLITPGNYLVSLATVLSSTPGGGPKDPVGAHARVVGRPAGARPRLLVIVVGETVRAQDWGLDGYARQTTPRLAQVEGLVNFTDVTACGSSTEVSVPCMFSPYGRHDYDAGRIRGSEGLLNVLDHAGIATLWRDNQSGCKGVCDGIAYQSFAQAGALDEIMLDGLADEVAKRPGDMVVVLHQLGNHGPAYSKRYLPASAKYTPACESADLARCNREQIVNAYDNAILHTDSFLARTIDMLAGMTGRDTAMLYVSDHGESLGEHGLYLHGVPWAIAPAEQTRVPMVLWLSDRFAAARGLDRKCLQGIAHEPASHDNLFHSVLGLMQVETPERDPRLDLSSRCTRPSRPAGA